MSKIDQLALQLDPGTSAQLIEHATRIHKLYDQLIEETGVLLETVAHVRVVRTNEPGSEDPGVC